MNRRKIALIFLPMFLLILILSPWATAPAPSVESIARPVRTEPEPSRPPAAVEKEPVRLTVAAALDEPEFEELQRMAESLALELPDIRADLVRTDPASAAGEFSRAAKLGEPADILLMDSARVKSFAVSGYLAPADGVFTGDVLAEPLEAVSAPLKWNGYLWGAPRDFDPYVLVWNPDVLKALLGENASPPQTLAEWTDLAVKSRTSPQPAHWLAIDGRDPLALLFWVEAAAGQRTDTLWNGKGANPWSGTAFGEALALLERERAGAAFPQESGGIEDRLLTGEAAGVVLPYSEARKLASHAGTALTIDRSAWKLPYVWSRGTSFAISSRTKEVDAARKWIAAMAGEEPQEANWETFGKLPVSRSFYQSGGLSSLFPGGGSASFPFQPPAEFDPGLPERLDRLRGLWQEFADGAIGTDEWVRRWSGLSADLQFHG
ncbi:extracellular solute-binding protein [Cohnella caldifontis]|uniref:extracellular solute-binding protein n=1 Tax=Cohnella caldifontis TaxID=3027471 RepID=UPI0023EAB0E2|nr:extracellular solute-binding protein [Cohnella sp. YIM B05605]